MLFKYCKKSSRTILLLSGMIYQSSLLADEYKEAPPLNTMTMPMSVSVTQFQVKPAKCVSLNQGRTCFATVNFTWQSQYQKQLCLYQTDPKLKIACWQPQTKKAIAFEFKSDKTKHYELINQQQKVLAETTIEVNWVYDAGPRKRRWRVF